MHREKCNVHFCDLIHPVIAHIFMEQRLCARHRTSSGVLVVRETVPGPTLVGDTVQRSGRGDRQ